MDRRDLLKMLATVAVGALFPFKVKAATPEAAIFPRPLYSGWVENKRAVRNFIKKHQYPFISQQDKNIRGTGKNKVVCLWKSLEKVTGTSMVPHNQDIGDCVSHAYGLGVDILTAIQIVLNSRPELWMGEAATEIIYAGSRVEIGGGELRGDGSNGVWAAEWLREYGVLLRQEYLNGQYDFTAYSGSVARDLGSRGNGVPDELEPICKLHPVKTVSLVNSWEECRDSVANGYPVAMCSNLGFNSTRDSDGFLRRGRKPWYHAMLIAGIDDEYHRPGALVCNSWGSDWVSGPTRHGQPAGSFWCDAELIDIAMRQGDSLALSNYVGYPRQDIPDYILW